MVTNPGSRRPWATLAILAVAIVLLWLAWQRLDASVATPDVGGVPTAGDSAAELRGASVERGGLESSVDREAVGDVAASVAQDATRGACNVLLAAMLTDGRPLQGVRYGLQSWPVGAGRIEGVSDVAGNCTLSVAPGRYQLDAVHDHHGLLSGEHLPRRVIEVPVGPLRTTWIPAYVTGLELVGAATFAGSDYVLFDPVEHEYVSVESSSHDHVTDTLTAKRLPGWTSVLYSRVPPGERSVTIFDRERGPCKVRIPAVFVGDYRGPLTVDLSAMPVVEPMCELEVLIQDCDGVPISDAKISVTRDARYAGVYAGGLLSANQVVYVPPGEYVVRYTSPVAGEFWIEKGVQVEAGSRRTLAWRSEYAVFDVVVKVGRGGMLGIDRGLVGGFGGQPQRVAGGDSVRISLPAGEFQVSLMERAGTVSGFAVAKEPIVVWPRRELQVQELFRLQ